MYCMSISSQKIFSGWYIPFFRVIPKYADKRSIRMVNAEHVPVCYILRRAAAERISVL